MMVVLAFGLTGGSYVLPLRVNAAFTCSFRAGGGRESTKLCFEFLNRSLVILLSLLNFGFEVEELVFDCNTPKSGLQRNIEYPRALLHRSIAQDMRTTTKPVMSSSDSAVTYTSISSKDIPFWEEDPKKYEDDETEDGPVDYPIDGGDDGDDDDGDSSRDDADDEDEDEEDEEEEEEENLALADSTIVVPNVELVSLPEGT
ncbi:hypothetical protein Tco_0622220 [Tanacetum coccineum]